ncbi:MAG: M28 family peptidase [Ferruginibacter sp.]
MKNIIVIIIFLATANFSVGQSLDKIIKLKEVKRIEQILSSDEMEGRRTFTPGIEKASAFIESEFKKIGLQTFQGAANYRQEFSMYQSTPISANISLDGNVIPDSLVAVFSFQPHASFTEKDSIEVVHIAAADKFGPKFYQYYQSEKNLLVLVDTSFRKRIGAIKHRYKTVAAPEKNSVIFVFANAAANTFSIDVTNEVTTKKLNNVVGILPGKSKPDEYVVFSGHYDHLGVGSPAEGVPHDKTDSIYNGANDDAAGSTAVIMLAKYFKKLNNNERSVIFVTFVAEELGGYGAQHFSHQLKPEQVIAMFNIEMIGTESKWGRNSAYITGFEKSGMSTILQKNLVGTSFTFHPDPYPDQQLFYRSDNATLARLGVPAHTISTSKMDSEPNYHKASDEIGTLDLENMREIIKAIALSSVTIVNGTDTPSRVDTTQLR